MRRYALVGVIAAGSAALALSMVLVNFAFEAAGSVPDLEGCGFLAGSLAALALIYPLLAGAMSARVAKSLARREVDTETILRAGAAIGAIGSGFYLCLGCVAVMRGPQGSSVSPNLWALSVALMLACAWAGKIGAAAPSGGGWPGILRRT